VAAPDVDKTPSPWATHRRRAEVLREHHPFAAEVLTVYLALLDVWEDGWFLAREEQPEPRQLARWTAERVLPRVVKATEATGPESLAAAVHELLDAGRLEESLAAWLAGAELPPVERYLARASLLAPLVALEADAGAACADDPSPKDGGRCPGCGGQPQLSFRSHAEDRLVSGRRHLICARCGQSWNYSGSSCPSCGETSGSRRTVYAERRDGPVVGHDAAAARGRSGAEPEGQRPDVVGTDDHEANADAQADTPTFPHLRIDACASCERYLIDVDLGRDPRAVPEVDELAAMPLDLYATEHGLSKITPNLMGF
jgi:FdhE protein